MRRIYVGINLTIKRHTTVALTTQSRAMAAGVAGAISRAYRAMRSAGRCARFASGLLNGSGKSGRKTKRRFDACATTATSRGRSAIDLGCQRWICASYVRPARTSGQKKRVNDRVPGNWMSSLPDSRRVSRPDGGFRGLGCRGPDAGIVQRTAQARPNSRQALAVPGYLILMLCHL
jgi:hypothetical protein